MSDRPLLSAEIANTGDPTCGTSPTHPEPPKGTSEWLDWFLGWHYQNHHVKLWDYLWFCIHTGNSTVAANAKQILENEK